MQEITLCLGKDYAGTLRPQKGKSLLDLVDSYVAVDIETTGFDSRFDAVIELAAVRVINGQITDKFQSLVRPNQSIPPFITELTGISDLMVAGAPLLESILPEFLAFVGDSTIVAHNANFDINFIYDFTRLFDLPAFSNNFIDTLRLSRRVFPQWNNHKLSTLVQNLNIQPTVEHRALSDSIQVSLCYEAMKAHIKENHIDLSFSYNSLSKHISTQTSNFNPDCPLYGKTFVFTGALERMARKDAMQHVVDAGGFCADGVTKETDFLVLGSNDYCSAIKGGKSNKQKKAEKMKSDGFDIEIISENVFYDMLEETSADIPNSETAADSRFLTEGHVFSSIRPTLITTIGNNNAPPDLLRLSKGRQYASVIYSSALVCHLHFHKGESFIDLTSQSPGEFVRIPVHSKEDLLDAAGKIAARLGSLIDQLPAQFDCCSRYAQCSDARKCINPDPFLAVSCRYRRNLKAGKVFCGKNVRISPDEAGLQK